MSPNAIDPYADLTLETVVEPGDIVTFEQPIGGETLTDDTEYTHGIVVEIVGRYTDRAKQGAPQQLGIAKYVPDEDAGLAGAVLDLETGKHTGIPAIADCRVDELILLYKPGRETGYSPHNIPVSELIDHYADGH
jgi:hypothetical protein